MATVAAAIPEADDLLGSEKGTSLSRPISAAADRRGGIVCHANEKMDVTFPASYEAAGASTSTHLIEKWLPFPVNAEYSTESLSWRQRDRVILQLRRDGGEAPGSWTDLNPDTFNGWWNSVSGRYNLSALWGMQRGHR